MPQAWDIGCDVLYMAQKYAGLDVSEARRLKALEDENARLKKLLAKTLLDAEALKIALSQKY